MAFNGQWDYDKKETSSITNSDTLKEIIELSTQLGEYKQRNIYLEKKVEELKTENQRLKEKLKEVEGGSQEIQQYNYDIHLLKRKEKSTNLAAEPKTKYLKK